jgi:hypothetical protein
MHMMGSIYSYVPFTAPEEKWTEPLDKPKLFHGAN